MRSTRPAYCSGTSARPGSASPGQAATSGGSGARRFSLDLPIPHKRSIYLDRYLIDALPPSPAVTRVEIAGPGFLNLYLARDQMLVALLRGERTTVAGGVGKTYWAVVDGTPPARTIRTASSA